jgi:hypothetical protein
MAIDEKARIKRAKKAGKASGKSRSKGLPARDALIVLGFNYLSENLKIKSDKDKVIIKKAIKFITEHGGSVNLKLNQELGHTPFRILADCMKLTRSRIQQIVKKDKNKI